MTETCDIRYIFTITNDIRMSLSLCISISLASKTTGTKYSAYHDDTKTRKLLFNNSLANKKPFVIANQIVGSRIEISSVAAICKGSKCDPEIKPSELREMIFLSCPENFFIELKL